MTVLSHAKEKHSSGSAAFLNKSISALNKNKKLILIQVLILLNQLQQFSKDSMQLISEIQN